MSGPVSECEVLRDVELTMARFNKNVYILNQNKIVIFKNITKKISTDRDLGLRYVVKEIHLVAYSTRKIHYEFTNKLGLCGYLKIGKNRQELIRTNVKTNYVVCKEICSVMYTETRSHI